MIKVLGVTTQQEVYIGSRERNFRINEFLLVEDNYQGDLMGEVVEAKTFNRYIPLSTSGDFVDDSVLESLRALGYNIDEETIYIAKVRLLNEAQYPVETGSSIRVPSFDEVRDLMIRAEKEEGLVIGAIRNTDSMYEEMDQELKGLFYTFEERGLLAQYEIPYILDLRSLHQYPHIGVFGGSGSGKSFGLRVVLEEVMKHNIPTVVLDPHFEMDFSQKADYIEEDISYANKFECLQIGIHVGVKFEDLSPQDLKNLLDSVSGLTDSMNNVVDNLLRKNDSYSSFRTRLDYLIEGQEIGNPSKLDDIIKSSSGVEKDRYIKIKEVYEKYDKTCPHTSVRGILWRLNRLYHDGIFSQDIRRIEEGLLNGRLIVIQGSTRILQVFSTYLLSNLYHKRRDYKDSIYKGTDEPYFPPFIIVTDEAHNFAPKGYDSPAKSILKEISQEGRKYGSFLILATQRPTLLDETITAQLNTKFIFRTVRASDIDTIKEETDLTIEETRRLPYLRTGDVFISSAALGRTIYARVRGADTKSPHTENPFDELRTRNKSDQDKFFNMVKDRLPLMSSELMNLSLSLAKEHGENLSLEDLEARLELLVDQGYIEREENFLGAQYKLGDKSL